MKPTVLCANVALAASLLFLAAPSVAQSDDQRAGARAAAEAGADAFEQGKWQEAADLFGRAERLMHAPPHLLYGARAHVKLGHLVEARELYLRLAQERLPDNSPRAFKDAQQAADKELAEVEARLPSVSIVVQGTGASEVRVTRDGVRVPSELLGVPHPVNPGEHQFQAFAQGMESAVSTVQIKDGARETVVLTLQPKAGATAAGTADGGTATGSGGLTGSDPSAPADQGSSGGMSGMKIGAFVGFGVAAVGAGVGTYFLIKSGNTRSDADDEYAECKAAGTCALEAKRIRGIDEDADGQRNVAVASYIVGGVGLATGVTLLILDSSRQQARNKPGIYPVIGLGYAGAAGRF